MDNSLKAKVKEVLYLRAPQDISYVELEKFSGHKQMRRLCYKNNIMSANICDLTFMRYKLNAILDVTDDNEEIMEIVDYEPSDSELAKVAGKTRQAINEAKRNAKDSSSAYAYSYWKHVLMFNKIDVLVHAWSR